MAKKSGDYWRASLSDARGLTVEGEAFDAVSVETDLRQRVWLHIGGLQTAQARSFVMPADPSLLRDLANALKKTAVDIEANGKKRSGGGPYAPPPCDAEDLYEGN